MTSVPFLIISAVFLAIFVGLIVLQVFLSRSKNKALGRIIPTIFFIIGLLFSVITVFNIVEGTAFDFVMAFILPQISTIIFYVIYLIVRSTAKEKDKSIEQVELEKMNIQDL